MSLDKTSKAWGKDDSGVAAIEFALLAWPFVITLVAIIELGMFFTTQVLMQAAMLDTARLIRTGEIQQMSQGSQLAAFQQQLCDSTMLGECENFQIEVRKLTGFDDDVQPTLDENDNLVPEVLFEGDEITAGCVGIIRIRYRYEFYTPVFGTLWAVPYPDYSNTRFLEATTIIETEPYEFDQAVDCEV